MSCGGWVACRHVSRRESAARAGRFGRKEQHYASLFACESSSINANQEARLTTSHQLTSLCKHMPIQRTNGRHLRASGSEADVRINCERAERHVPELTLMGM